MKRKFKVTYTVVVELEIPQEVFDAVDDDFRKHIYDFRSDDEVAEHLAYNFARNNVCSVDSLDGWADKPSELMTWKDVYDEWCWDETEEF